MNLISDCAIIHPGPSEDEYRAAMIRADKAGVVYALLILEDADGGVWVEPVNVPSTVHQEGIMYRAMLLFQPGSLA